MAPQVSVVFATHNREGRVADLLASLRRQELDDFEVIAVDDASTDGTSALLASAGEGLNLRVIRHEESRGPSAARNAGWRAARAPLVAFTDDDCVAMPSWLSAGVAAANAMPGAVVQGRTEPNPDELDSIGPFSRTLEVTERGPYYQTCNIFYPREVLERLGGFDEKRFTVPGGEDADLAWRAIESGVPVEFEPEALVHHAVADLGPMGKLRVGARWQESMVIYKEHPGLREAVFTKRIFWKGTHYLLLRALLGLAALRFARPFAVWLAYPYFKHMLSDRRHQERASMLIAPYWILHDLVEIAGCVRASVRERMIVL
jgi:glycosyltransferase involved in cell wall biosynthesis